MTYRVSITVGPTYMVLLKMNRYMETLNDYAATVNTRLEFRHPAFPSMAL